MSSQLKQIINEINQNKQPGEYFVRELLTEVDGG